MDRRELEDALQHVLFDSNIVEHGFMPYLRDYQILSQFGSKRVFFRFTHCVSAVVTTTVPDELWLESWEDVFTSRDAWEKAGCPKGYLWGVNYAVAYPGATVVANSSRARDWSTRLGKQMWEIRIETNTHNIELIFHDLRVSELLDSSES
jgi:hypothetical protein